MEVCRCIPPSLVCFQLLVMTGDTINGYKGFNRNYSQTDFSVVRYPDRLICPFWTLRVSFYFSDGEPTSWRVNFSEDVLAAVQHQFFVPVLHLFACRTLPTSIFFFAIDPVGSIYMLLNIFWTSCEELSYLFIGTTVLLVVIFIKVKNMCKKLSVTCCSLCKF